MGFLPARFERSAVDVMNTVFRTVSRLLRAPVRRFVRPNPKLNSLMWDAQYALGFWRYLDHLSDGAMPLSLIETWAPRPTILDLGCGTSANMPLPAGRYRHYHGVDVSAKAIDLARKLDRPATSFEVADIRTYHTEERYDAILLREVLYYLTETESLDLLRRLPDMLTPVGRIVVQIHDVAAAADVVALVRTCGVAVVGEVPVRLDDRPAGVFLLLGAPAGAARPVAAP